MSREAIMMLGKLVEWHFCVDKEFLSCFEYRFLTTLEGCRMLLQFARQGLIRYRRNKLFEMSFVSILPIHASAVSR